MKMHKCGISMEKIPESTPFDVLVIPRNEILVMHLDILHYA